MRPIQLVSDDLSARVNARVRASRRGDGRLGPPQPFQGCFHRTLNGPDPFHLPLETMEIGSIVAQDRLVMCHVQLPIRSTRLAMLGTARYFDPLLLHELE